ncbi:MAG: hypothetical protein N3F63_00060 [Thermoplasmata archaeon]|nr:hypothetical protein [Thermoplasmata archaeon]
MKRMNINGIKIRKIRKLTAIVAITSCAMLIGLVFLHSFGGGTNGSGFEDRQTAVPEGTVNEELRGTKVGSKGVWVWGTDVANVGASALASEFAKHGISDVFVLIKGTSGDYRFDKLDAMFDKCHGYGIRVHAWVICFCDDSWGGWVNPSSDTYRAYLKNNIFIPLAKYHRFDGVVLDCIRYPGTAYGNTYPITSFCKEVTDIIKSYRSNALMGAAVMPEMAANAYYYGQDYTQMAQHLDVLMPMAYTHNYHTQPSWVGTVTQYVRQKALQGNSNCKVWTAIQSLDDNGQFMSTTELQACINYAISGGAAGINFFKYPITSKQYQILDMYPVDTTPPPPDNTKVGSKGVWVWGTDVANVGAPTLASEFAKHGISDVFVLIKGVSGAYRFDRLDAMYEKCHANGIRVHAWVVCFLDESAGGWVNPYSETYRAYLKNEVITPLAKDHKFDGVVLDYIRYSGTAYGSPYPITSFCREVSTIVKSYKPSALVGATVEPGMDTNAYVYGQDYAQMSQYLDVLIPLTYTHKYSQQPSWVATVVRYVCQNAHTVNPNCRVWAAVQSLDDNGNYMSNTELQACISYALSGGAAGINFFRYPITSAQYQIIDRYSVDNSPPSPSSLTKQEAFEACIELANYIDEHYRTPKYVTTTKGNIPMPQMLYISSKLVYDLSTGSPNSSYHLITCDYAPNPFGEAYSGSLGRNEYVDMAYRVYGFIEKNGAAPNYANTPVGKIRMWEILYINARVVRWYYYNGLLPSLAYVKPVPGFRADANSQYTGATANCQATNGQVINFAMSIICTYSNKANNGTLSANDAMYLAGEAIYSWVRDNKGYAFYYNTRYGAYRAIFEASAINCCDHANAENALARAVGIPALYRHAYCQFSSGAYGHVWGYFYINGKGWINADPVKKSGGYFGYRYPIINDWGTYYTLPFVIEN